MMEEIWKDIPEYEGMYQISNFGRVKSLGRPYTNRLGHTRTLKERYMTLVPNTSGYLEFACCNNNVYKRFRVHRLVAMTFIPNPENKPQVNHIDGDKTNNRVDNLEWNTASENIQHAFDTGLMKQYTGEKNPASKLTKDDVITIKRLLNEKNMLQKEIAELFNVEPSLISMIKYKKIWKHVDF